MKTCPSCGTKSNSKFCPECGTDLSSVPDVKICPNCGTESMAKFCPECGTNLTETTPSFEGASTVQESEVPVVDAISDAAIVVSEMPQSIERQNPEINDEESPVGEFIPPQDQRANVEIPVGESISSQDQGVNEEIPVGKFAPTQVQGVNEEIPVGGFVPPQNNNPKKSKKKILIIIGAVLLVLIIVGAIAGGGDEETSSTTPTETESYYEDEEAEEETTEPTTTEPTTEAFVDEFTKKEDYKEISYDKLARNPDDYEFELVKGSGNVLQVMDGDDEVDLRIGTSSDGYDDVVLAYYDPRIVDSRILEDDQVTYYGQSLGLYTYESTMGGNITIPLVKIHKITRN